MLASMKYTGSMHRLPVPHLNKRKGTFISLFSKTHDAPHQEPAGTKSVSSTTANTKPMPVANTLSTASLSAAPTFTFGNFTPELTGRVQTPPVVHISLARDRRDAREQAAPQQGTASAGAGKPAEASRQDATPAAISNPIVAYEDELKALEAEKERLKAVVQEKREKFQEIKQTKLAQLRQVIAQYQEESERLDRLMAQ
jgi:hypothetical protein